jgi:hypothetical protein
MAENAINYSLILEKNSRNQRLNGTQRSVEWQKGA